MGPLNQKMLVDKISEIVGAEYVTDDPTAAFAYSQDTSLFGGTEAAVVVRPGSTEEVSQIMKLAGRHELPVVVRGGGSSIYGQPKGKPGENLLIDMTRMNNILELNQEGMTVSAQAGIMMGKLQLACNSAGYYVFVPAGPAHTVSLGGWLSGAAGGGGIFREIVSITVVLPDGTVVKTGAGPGTNIRQKHAYFRNLGGPDFSGLFIGDGGSFGIKTEVTIRLLGLPKVTRACLLEFENLEDVLALLKSHGERVNPHPFDPVLVFGPKAMELFSSGSEKSEKFTAMALMQGHTELEMDAKRDIFDALAQKHGGTHNPALDAMAGLMAGGGEGEEQMEMFGLSFFNGLGLAAWLPFHIPRISLAELYPKLIAWRDRRLEQAAKLGFECTGCFEFFTPSDQCALSGEVDAFFKDADDPKLREFVREMILDFQKYTHDLGLLDVYNQGAMSRLNASCWSPGFKSLYRTVKKSLDPREILNGGLWCEPSEKTGGGQL